MQFMCNVQRLSNDPTICVLTMNARDQTRVKQYRQTYMDCNNKIKTISVYVYIFKFQLPQTVEIDKDTDED